MMDSSPIIIEMVSSDDEDCLPLISSSVGGGSRSKRAKKQEEEEEEEERMVSFKEKKPECKDKQVVQVSPAAAAASSSSHNKNNKRKRIVSSIAVNKIIPNAKFFKVVNYRSRRTETCVMRKYRTGKKVVMYGLPGYQPYQVINPCKDFLEQADSLKAQGVDEIIFIAVNPNIINAWRAVRVEEYCKFVLDVDAFTETKMEQSFIFKLGLLNLEDPKPLQTARRYILVVDNLRVKLANIESFDGTFTVSTTEKIVEAFNQ